MKRFVYSFILVVLVVALMPIQQPAAAQPPAQELDRNAQYVPGEVLVTFPTGISTRSLRAKANALAGQVGATVVQQYANFALLSLDPEADVFAASVKLAAAYQGVSAQPNYVYSIPEADDVLREPFPVEAYTLSSPSGRKVSLSWEQVSALRSRHRIGTSLRSMPTYPREFTTGPIDGAFWGWNEVQADLIWSDSKAVGYVCELDTGVDYSHPDLSGMVIYGYDFVNNDSKPYDDNGHGTHVAGIISAKLNNSNGTAMGVSKTRILAVKVLNAQGFGTTYNIAAGINYCMKNSSAKVINMSLGSYANDKLLFSVLKLAVVNKARLVVAAAGNETTSDYVYPAAWADPNTPLPDPSFSPISNGVISVAAGRSPSPYSIWVDRNDDGNINPSSDPAQQEVFNAKQCASGLYNEAGPSMGSNYGSWVNLVAPGENIYSTTPVSYPFYKNYYEDVPSGYAYMSGTSMAAAFVSGAAARVLTTMTSADRPAPAGIKDRLIDGGDTLALVVDSNAADPTSGYNNLGAVLNDEPDLTPYGKPFGQDPNDPNLQIVMAPFCWPTTGGNFTADQDMSGARYLNVAKAMKRGALVAEIKDAFSGSPTTGASVTASIGSTTYDLSLTNGEPFVVLINLPKTSSNFNLKVTKSGSTIGYQTFNQNVPIDIGASKFDDYNTVSLPSSVNMHAVLDWLNPIAGPGLDAEATVDLDLYMVLPDNSNCDGNCVIGPESAYDENQSKYQLDPYIDAHFFGAGTLMNPTDFFGTWSPYAIHNFDGVTYTTDPMHEIGTPTELITLRYGVSLSSNPYYKPKSSGIYQFLVTDYSPTTGNGYLNGDPELVSGKQTNEFYVAPVLRYWSKGRILATVKLAELASPCDGTKAWWAPLTLNGSNGRVSAVNTCQDILP